MLQAKAGRATRTGGRRIDGRPRESPTKIATPTPVAKPFVRPSGRDRDNAYTIPVIRPTAEPSTSGGIAQCICHHAILGVLKSASLLAVNASHRSAFRYGQSCGRAFARPVGCLRGGSTFFRNASFT